MTKSTTIEKALRKKAAADIHRHTADSMASYDPTGASMVRREADAMDKAATETSPAAKRQRRYRQRQHDGIVVTAIEIDVDDVLAFESAGLLEIPDADASHLSKAVRVILDEWCRQSEAIGCSCDTLFVGRKSGPE